MRITELKVGDYITCREEDFERLKLILISEKVLCHHGWDITDWEIEKALTVEIPHVNIKVIQGTICDNNGNEIVEIRRALERNLELLGE